VIKIRRTILLLALIMLGLPAVLFASRVAPMSDSTAQAADAENLSRYTVTEGVVEVVVSAVGAIESQQDARVSFRDPGRIAVIDVSIGDRVRAGDVLAAQSNETQQLALEAADLTMAAAQLQKDDLTDGVSASDLAIAEANIAAAIGAYNSIANAVDADLIRAAELQYQAAQQSVVDAQTTRATSGGSPESIALLDAQVGQASFSAEIARLNLESARRGSGAQAGAARARVGQAEAERDRLLAGATNAQLDAADGAIARAQIAVDRAQAALDQTVISAPFDGVVTAVSGDVGAIALPGVAVVTMADAASPRLRVQVDEIDVRQVRGGMDARVLIDALRGVDLPAVLETIALVPTINAGIVTYDVEVALLESDPRVRLGMTAEALIVVERREGVLVVPNEYIRLGRGVEGASVNVIDAAGILVETAVALGLQGETTSEITSGVRAGDVVAVTIGGDAIFSLGG